MATTDITTVIDLDANATTRPLPCVCEAVARMMREVWGNPSSDEPLGQLARARVEESRRIVAAMIEAEPEQIVFTSGATEAINLAIVGTLSAIPGGRPHVVATATEHTAVMHTLEHLARIDRADITVVQPDQHGIVSAKMIEAVLRPDTRLICVIHGNNEIGSLNPVEQIARLASQHNVATLVDASQSLAYLPLSVRDEPIDLLVISGHKMHGPKGIGALFVRDGARLTPLAFGGGQERGFRPGTEAVPLIAGLAEACRFATLERGERAVRVAALRDQLWSHIRTARPDAILNGHPTDRLPSNLNVTVPGLSVSSLRNTLPQLCFSTSSACTANTGVTSHVLRAIGLDADQAKHTIRFGVSCMSTPEEIDVAGKQIGRFLKQIRDYAVPK